MESERIDRREARTFWPATLVAGVCVGVFVAVLAAAVLLWVAGPATWLGSWGLPVCLLVGALAAAITVVVIRRIGEDLAVQA